MKKLKSVLHNIYSGPWWQRVFVWLFTFLLLLLLLLVAVDINFLWLFGRSPGFRDIKHPVTYEASVIISADSLPIGRYYNENRTSVTFQDISPIMVRTLIATEDERFYHHRGIDVKGLFAAVKDMFGGHARGASTITQQLAKNLFRVRTKEEYSTGLLGKWPFTRLLSIKAKEWIVATKLELLFSKEEILTMYLNTVDFGSNAFGIKTASATYFGTTPDNLTYEQAATLVGLLKATSTYNPKRNPKNSTERRNIVLTNLYDNGGMIVNGIPASKQQLDSLQRLPMVTAERQSGKNFFGPVPYFREAVRDHIKMLCEHGLIKGHDAEHPLDLDVDGLKIYTTLDTRIQQYAEVAVHKQMRAIQKRFRDHWGNTPPWQDGQHREIPNFAEDIAKKTSAYKYLEKKYNGNEDSINYYLNLPHPVEVFTYDGEETRELSTLDSIRYMLRFMHCGLVAIEPDTRHVKAWVGDVDYNSWEYDKVTAMRQPGSTFKLFVYTEAMNQGMKPCDTRVDEWKAYPDTVDGKPKQWMPHNANGYFSNASQPLKGAFAQSINSIAVKLGYECGISNVARTAHAMGIESPLKEKPSLSLGSSDVNLLELTNAYCTPIADGIANMPILVTRIEDRYGRVIYEPKLSTEQAIPYRSAYLMQQMLRATMTEPGGTSGRLWSFVAPMTGKVDFGGKTGTSNNHADAWFIGVTPGLVGGVWVGGEYRSIHFRTGELGQGNRTALPVFGDFIQAVLRDSRFSRYLRKFAPPREGEGINPSDWACVGTYYAPPSDEDSLDIEFGETPTNHSTTFIIENEEDGGNEEIFDY
ncbi:MAG: transglycosylase domain-containing protein [Bacteroidaceae bacterium]|nr:transglycosylase domain-containing protein [Bacteroidaceae bacterium]